MVCTEVFQSKMLLDVGIDAATADMWWNIEVGGYSNPSCMPVSDADIPAWSLSALLQLMPKDKDVTWELSYGGWDLNYFQPVEKFFITYETKGSEEIHTENSDNPVSAVFKMIVWLKEQKKI